jgi:hypothetical protein
MNRLVEDGKARSDWVRRSASQSGCRTSSTIALETYVPKESTLGDSELRSLTKQHLRTNVRHRHDYERVVVGVLEDGRGAGCFSLIDAKLTAYALIAHSSHVGTWYRASGRLSLEAVADAYVALALRMVAADPLPEADVVRLVRDAQAFHEAFSE